MSDAAKRVAAVAAVYAWLARQGRAAAAPGGGAGPAPGGGPSLWALYGRQALMNQRIRMQSRRRT